MGGKPRVTVELQIHGMTDKAIFMELGRRGYECTDFRGSKKLEHFFSGDQLVVKTKFILFVPEGKYPLVE